MSEQKELKIVAAGEPAMEKLFEALDENEVHEDLDLKSLELALKNIELEMKSIRRKLKAYRKKKPAASVLKG